MFYAGAWKRQPSEAVRALLYAGSKAQSKAFRTSLAAKVASVDVVFANSGLTDEPPVSMSALEAEIAELKQENARLRSKAEAEEEAESAEARREALMRFFGRLKHQERRRMDKFFAKRKRAGNPHPVGEYAWHEWERRGK